MTTHTGAARMLALSALAALLALLGGARAGAAGGACGPHTTPKITFNAREDVEGYDFISYGGDIVVNCSANDTAKLGLKENDISIQSNQTNTTSIQFRVITPNIGQYVYSCADSGTGCEAFVIVLVKPAVSVECSRVQQRLEHGYYYYVPLGNNYDVYCSANYGASLHFESFNERLGSRQTLQTEVVNGTTIKHRTHADFLEDIQYICTGSGTGVTAEKRTVEERKIVAVTQNLMGYRFRCILKYLLTFECSWTYPSYWEYFTCTLFYLNYDLYGQEFKRPCVDMPGEQNNTCKWNKPLKKQFYDNNHNLSFILMTCTDLICYNQSFLMDLYSITRLESVHYVEASNTSSRDLVLFWPAAQVYVSGFASFGWEFICKSCSYEHKVEYRLTAAAFGDGWHATIASAAQCDGGDNPICKYRLVLPYPDEEYEVRVYARLKQATDDRLWSDPKSIFVHTQPRAECACERPAEPTTAISFDSASCDICTFARDTINNNSALKRKVQDMKEKLAKIKKLSKFIQMGKEVHDSD